MDLLWKYFPACQFKTESSILEFPVHICSNAFQLRVRILVKRC